MKMKVKKKKVKAVIGVIKNEIQDNSNGVREDRTI